MRSTMKTPADTPQSTMPTRRAGADNNRPSPVVASPSSAGPEFQSRILDWFDHHGRKSLPWQQRNKKKRDPYAIWVAEIMLQQTRVSTVIPYYLKFMARFPNIKSLASCESDELLHYWSGLGYYARARNLHAAAKKIVTQHANRFPDCFDDVVALPGIGRSTAGAILAFAWGQRHPILDGNVKRVLTRYYAIAGHPSTRKVELKLWEIAEQLTPTMRIGDYTQAMMDLGSGVCTRTKPLCESCPLATDCQAYQGGSGNPTAFPQPRLKPKPARPKKSAVMLLIKNRNAELLLVKRPPLGIWGGLWAFPEYPNTAEAASAKPTKKRSHSTKQTIAAAENQAIIVWCEQQFGLAVELGEALPRLKHSFTHFDLDILPLPAVVTKTNTRVMDSEQHLWYNQSSPAQIGLPKAVNRILEQYYDT